QLGDGTKEDRSAPVPIRSLDKGVKAIAAGDSHICALIERGGVSCLGTHWETVDEGLVINIRRVLLKAVGSSKFKAIASGSDHTCALTERGSVVCAGDNFHSQLGDGSFTFKTDLTKVTAYARPVAAIAGGDDHTCVLTTEGGVRCWGRNQYGQLGNGEFGISPTPAAVVN
ncbi:MAG: RCC1 domain-containing protein, partial [Thermoflexales bacterium]